MEIRITSPAFAEGGFIPGKHTCGGINVSPPLEWNGVPSNTETLAFICDDPDAPFGTWVHWVIFNIPVSVKKLEEGIPPEKNLNNGARQGINDFQNIGYGGPCPPSGAHRYFFKIYALDTLLDLKPGITKEQLTAAMHGHILAQGSLMGKYSRK